MLSTIVSVSKFAVHSVPIWQGGQGCCLVFGRVWLRSWRSLCLKPATLLKVLPLSILELVFALAASVTIDGENYCCNEKEEGHDNVEDDDEPSVFGVARAMGNSARIDAEAVRAAATAALIVLVTVSCVLGHDALLHACFC